MHMRRHELCLWPSSAAVLIWVFYSSQTSIFDPLARVNDSAGRKHQLRLHCARHLVAPIVGDERHGTVRSAAQRGLPSLLGPEAAAAAKGRLQLHAHSITIDRGGSGGSGKAELRVHVVAPAPAHMSALLHSFGWSRQLESQ